MAISFPDPTGQPTDGSFTYTDPGNGQEYSWNGFGWDLVCSDGGSGGADTFLELTDTPSTMGTAGQTVVVNAAGDALEFADALTGPGGYTLWHGDTLPTTTPEGDPVEEASLFFHTTILKLFIYTGGAWLEL